MWLLETKHIKKKTQKPEREILPSEAPKGASAANALILAQQDSFWISNPQNYKINLGCFELLILL